MTISLIRNGTLIDGTGSPPLPNAGVLIQEDRIHLVGQADSLNLPNAPINEIDADGGYILPGFIDTHVHLMFEGVNLARDMATPFSMRFYKSVEYLRRTLEAGITSVRDAGGADAGLKQAVETGVVPGPRVQISIAVLTITGGHVDFWMRSGNEFHLFPAYPVFLMVGATVWTGCVRKYVKCYALEPKWSKSAQRVVSSAQPIIRSSRNSRRRNWT